MNRALRMAAVLALSLAHTTMVKEDSRPVRKVLEREPDPVPDDKEPECVKQFREARRLRAERKMQKGHWK